MSHGTPIATIDCHSDIMIDVWRRRSQGERAVLADVHGPAYAEGGVVAAVCMVGGDVGCLAPFGLEESYRSAVALLDALHADAAESDGRVAVVGSAAELEACVERGVFAVLPWLEGALPVEGDLGKLRDLHVRGVRGVGLTWNSRNALAVGLDSGRGGLTALGVRAIELMHELGIVIDLAHASTETFWDVARVSRAPLFASHANAAAVHEHPRNLDDEQLRAIRESGGAVGLVLCPGFLGPAPVTLETVAAHLAHFRATVGADAVVIGADFCDYAIQEMRADIEAHGGVYDAADLRYAPGMDTVAAMQNVVGALSGAGYDGAGAAKVARLNFLRLLRETESLARA